MFPKYVLLSICAFIRVHFGRPGKFSQHSPFRCIHIFFQKLVMISDFFFKEKLEVISFQKHVGFSAKQLIFLFLFPLFFLTCSLFPLLALFFSYLPSFSSFFYFCFFLFFFYYYYFLDDVPKRRTLHGSRISNIIDSNDINTNATIQTKMYALYK